MQNNICEYTTNWQSQTAEGLEVQTEEENEKQVCMEANWEWKDEKRKDDKINKYGNLNRNRIKDSR